MSNKRITDLTELTNPTTDDVFPVVDIATNTTTKVQLGNLPVPSSVTTALATKQDSLVSGTNIKTINSTSVLGSGNIAVQETLVSGTNIKTLNNTSLLGSGNIVLTANPSGVSGAIQFSNGSAFASDAANLFWDDTNNRLGVGTNAPGQSIETTGGIRLSGSGSQTLEFSNASSAQFRAIFGGFSFRSSTGVFISNVDGTPTARLHIQGSGSTSATTSLLVQDSAGTERLKLTDAGTLTVVGINTSIVQLNYINTVGGVYSIMQGNNANGNAKFYQFVSIGTSSDPVASAALEVVSTTKGFLPPRMTTTQKNAIASPAAGLVVYDSTTNKLQCYNGSTWNDLF
jgi:hypothetical protein